MSYEATKAYYLLGIHLVGLPQHLLGETPSFLQVHLVQGTLPSTQEKIMKSHERH